MKQATYAALFSIPILAFIAYLILKDDSETETFISEGQPLSLPSPNLSTNTNSSSGATPTKLYSTESGEGFEAVKFSIKNIMSDDSLLRKIKKDANIENYFSGVSNDFFKSELFSNTGSIDEIDIPLYPSFIERNQKDVFERIINFNFSDAMSSRGRASATNDLITMMSVDSIYGDYDIANDRDSIHDDVVTKRTGAGGYGNPWNDKGRDENWKKFYDDAVKLSENYLDNISKFDRAIVDEAVKQLSVQGWKFIGYHTP